jgi:hypothetical protein
MSKARTIPTPAEVADILSEHFELENHAVGFDYAANLLRARLRTTRLRAREWLRKATEVDDSPLVWMSAEHGYLHGVRKVNRKGGFWCAAFEEGVPVHFSVNEYLKIDPLRDESTDNLRLNNDGSFFDSPSRRATKPDTGMASGSRNVIILDETLRRFMDRARVVTERHRVERQAESIVDEEAIEAHMGEDFRTIKKFLGDVFVDSERALRGSAPHGKDEALTFSSVNITLLNEDIARFAEGLRKLGIAPEPRS